MIQISDNYSAVEVLNIGDTSPDFMENLLSNLNDFDHLRFSRHGLTQHTLETCKRFLQELKVVGGHYFQIRQIENGLNVGTFSVKPLGESGCEAGILVFKEFANQGVAFAIWQFLPKFIASLNFDFLVAGTHIQNLPMRRVFEKTGMVLDATRNYPHDKNSNPENIYYILKV